MRRLIRLRSLAAGAVGAVVLIAACEYLFDTSRPKIQFVTPGEADTVYSPVLFELNVQDGGFKTLDLYVDGARVRSYDSAHVLDSLNMSAGEHVLSARAHDRGGNWAEEGLAVAVVVLPIPVLDSPADGSVLAESVPRFRWSYAGTAGEYQLQVDNNGDFSSPAIDTTTADTSYGPGRTLADGGYVWHVRARGAPEHWSGWSSTWGLAVAVAGIAAPTLYEPTSGDTVGDATPDFDWSEPAGAVGYWLQVDDDQYFLSPEVDEQALTLSHYTPTATMADGRHYWRVKAQNAAQVLSGWSAAYDFTVVSTGMPQLLEPADSAVLTTRQPRFTWSHVAGAGMYWLQVDSEPSFAAPLVVSDSVNDTTLVPTVDLSDGDYWWRVRSRASSGIWGGWAGARRFSIATQGPPPPALLQPANDTLLADNAPLFDWDSVPAAAQYWLQVAANDSFSPLILSRNGISAHEYKAIVPLADTTYYWRVKTANASGGWGAWAVAWTFEVWTTPPTPSTPADGAFCWNLDDVTFGWNSVNGATSYGLQVASDSGFLLIETDTVLFSANCNWTPDEKQGLLYWRVRAAKNGMWGKWSGERRLEVGPFEVGSYDTPGEANDLVVSGSYAYVADGAAGLRIVRVADPESIEEVGRVDTPGDARDVVVSGVYAYVADGTEGLQIVSISDPANPVIVGSCKTTGVAYGVALSTVAGFYACLADGPAGFVMVDISNPASPTKAGSLSTPDAALGVCVAPSDNLAAVSAGTAGMKRISIANPNAPSEFDGQDTPGHAQATIIRGLYGYHYVADGDGGIRVMNFYGDWENINSAPAMSWVYDVAQLNMCVYAADNEAGLRVLDASDMRNALPELGRCDTPGTAKGVMVIGRYAYVADGPAGIRVIKVRQ